MMTDDVLAAIRARVEAATPAPSPLDVPAQQVEANLRFVYAAYADMKALLLEVERLRAQNAALREIAQAMADVYEGRFGIVRDAVLCYNDNADRLECPWCYGQDNGRSGFAHETDCPVTKARALLDSEETK